MSAHTQVKRLSVPKLTERKGGEPLVCLTAYTAPMAKILDSHVDLLLVGDSLAQVVHGMDSTVPVPLELMIFHAQAVMRGSQHAVVVVDLPFGSYEESPQIAFRNAARVLKETGAQAVKLEGGRVMAETVAYLTNRGIPVLGHIGLLPQHQNARGYRVAGRNRDEWSDVMADAKAIEAAGAFAVVIEGTSEPLAREITAALKIQTIGIGASPACDGQILVTEDMLGLFTRVPSFVKRYAQLGSVVSAAVAEYAAEVRSRAFPEKSHTYAVKD